MSAAVGWKWFVPSHAAQAKYIFPPSVIFAIAAKQPCFAHVPRSQIRGIIRDLQDFDLRFLIVSGHVKLREQLGVTSSRAPAFYRACPGHVTFRRYSERAVVELLSKIPFRCPVCGEDIEHDFDDEIVDAFRASDGIIICWGCKANKLSILRQRISSIQSLIREHFRSIEQC